MDLLINLFFILAGLVLANLSRLKRDDCTRVKTFIVFNLLLTFILGGSLILINRTERFSMFVVVRIFSYYIFIYLQLYLVILLISLKGRLVRVLVLLIIVLISALGFRAFLYEPYNIDSIYYDLHVKGLAMDELKILQVSDLQAEDWGAYEHKVFAMISNIRPHLIIYTGDYIQVDDLIQRQKMMAEFRELLKQYDISPQYGSYAVRGNNESIRGFKAIFRGTGVKTMINRSVLVNAGGFRINISGLSLSESFYLQRLKPAELFDPRADLNIITGHAPDFILDLQYWRKEFLALAGHTHGGQIVLPFLGPPVTLSRLSKEYADCFTVFGSGVLSVSRGIGAERSHAPAVRFNCPPELRVIRLMPAEC